MIQNDYNKEIELELVKVFSNDLTCEIANDFVGKLFESINGYKKEIPMAGKVVYQKMISKVYAPYVKAFSYKIDEVCQEIGAVPLCLARDAIPIYYSLMKQGVDAKLGFFTNSPDIFGKGCKCISVVIAFNNPSACSGVNPSPPSVAGLVA